MEALRQQPTTPPVPTGKKPIKRSLSHVVAIGMVVLIALSLLLFFVGINRMVAATSPCGIAIEFCGEYSWDQENWKPLTKDTTFNALDGDLYLRGNFNEDVSGLTLQFYLNHIEFSVSANGEMILDQVYTEVPGEPAVCDMYWESWKSDAFSANDTLLLRLHNPYAYGNPMAYQELLGNLYICGNLSFDDFMLNSTKADIESVREGIPSRITAPLVYSGKPWKVMGIASIVIAALLLGIAFADTLQGALLGTKLWKMGLLAVAMGLCILLDTSDVELWSYNGILNTYGALLGRMLAMLFLPLLAADFLQGRPAKLTLAASAVGGTVQAVLLLLCTADALSLFNMVTVWAYAQTAILALVLACGVFGFIRDKNVRSRAQLSIVLILLCAALTEQLNGWFGWWTRGHVLNGVFLVALIAALVWIAIEVPAQYRAARSAAEMKLLLSENRIALMLSQIQPHFLYNALSTIRALCHRDPDQAELATIEFTTFLRGNMESLTADKPISFAQELEHTKSYLALEKQRFQDRLNVVYDIQTDLFRLPTLTLQPLVENAVRCGVTQRVEGGTITIATRETPKAFVVTVVDDGVGFLPDKQPEDDRAHIGISNVRSRLAEMCGGTLDIVSTVNVGTTATITIPREATLC